MTLQRIANIAARYATAMADAMLDACRRKADETGVRLRIRARPLSPPGRARRRDPYDLTEAEWRRMVERNSDTRWNHC